MKLFLSRIAFLWVFAVVFSVGCIGIPADDTNTNDPGDGDDGGSIHFPNNPASTITDDTQGALETEALDVDQFTAYVIYNAPGSSTKTVTSSVASGGVFPAKFNTPLKTNGGVYYAFPGVTIGPPTPSTLLGKEVYLIFYDKTTEVRVLQPQRGIFSGNPTLGGPDNFSSVFINPKDYNNKDIVVYAYYPDPNAIKGVLYTILPELKFTEG